jgi:hypothetical protein
MGTIRIINDKTGQVKFVSEIVANNTKTLEMYGFKVQHLGNKEENLPITNVIGLDGQRERYKKLFGKYPAGRMKPETIAKEIQEAETKQNINGN